MNHVRGRKCLGTFKLTAPLVGVELGVEGPGSGSFDADAVESVHAGGIDAPEEDDKG